MRLGTTAPQNSPISTLAEYHAALKAHDWFHMYSDDGRVVRNGEARRTQLIGLAREHGGKWQAMFNAWQTFINDQSNRKPTEEPRLEDFQT